MIVLSIKLFTTGYNLTTNISSGNWKALRIHLRGPFEGRQTTSVHTPLQASLFVIADHSFHDYASNQSIPADLLPTRNCSNFVVVCASSVAIGTPPDGPTACQVNSTHCVVVLQFV